MEIAVWIVSGLLAAVYLGAGLMKSLRSKQALRESLPWVDSFSGPAVKAIGVIEVLGALGLILPVLTGVAPVLTPIAAIGLVIVQIVAIVVHVRLNQTASLPVNLLLLIAAGFVAVARFAGV